MVGEQQKIELNLSLKKQPNTGKLTQSNLSAFDVDNDQAQEVEEPGLSWEKKKVEKELVSQDRTSRSAKKVSI
jgi:hypothetical protein